MVRETSGQYISTVLRVRYGTKRTEVRTGTGVNYSRCKGFQDNGRGYCCLDAFVFSVQVLKMCLTCLALILLIKYTRLSMAHSTYIRYIKRNDKI